MRLQRRTLFVPTSVSSSGSTGGTSHAIAGSAPTYNEPQFSRALLYSLLALLVATQTAFDGIRFGFNAPDDSLALPLMHWLREPAAFSADPFRFVAGACASPFWVFMASLNEIVPQKYALFSGVLLLAHAASAVAVFRLAERIFGHSLGALLTAALWLGLGSFGLHHNFLAPGDVALALWLWTLVLWHEERSTWALPCGLAASADILPSFLLFALLWTATWLRPLRATVMLQAAPHALWRRVQYFTSERIAQTIHALFWFALGALPLCLFQAPRWSESSSVWAQLYRMAAPAWPQDAPRAVWQVAVLLLAGAWCWRASLRVPATRALAFVAIMLSIAIAAAVWLFSVQPHNNPFIFAVARLSPLGVVLGLLGITHILERSAARRGSGGLLGLFVLIGFAVFARQPLALVFGIVFLEGAGRLARQTLRQNKSRGAAQRGTISLLCARAGRWALCGFMVLWCVRARLAVGARLNYGDGVLSARQNADWLQIQLWAKANTPHDAVFLADAPGFRTFSERPVFLDVDDEKWIALSPQFARAWQLRYSLAAPLWNQKVRPNVGVLSKLRAHGITHVVVRRDDARLTAWMPFLQFVGRNRVWAIYRVRKSD